MIWIKLQYKWLYKYEGSHLPHRRNPMFLFNKGAITNFYYLQVTSVALVFALCQNFFHLFQDCWQETQVAINTLHCTLFKVFAISIHLLENKEKNNLTLTWL